MNEPESASPVVNAGESSLKLAQMLVLLLLTGGGIALCAAMTLPFLPALAVAIALAVLFLPLQRRLETRLRSAGIAAGISVLVIGVMVVVPAVFVGGQLAEQAVKGAEVIESRFKSGEWREAIKARPQLASYVERIEKQVDASEALSEAGKRLSVTAGSLVKGSAVQLIGLVFVFYLLFFFLRDRQLMIEALHRWSPIKEPDMDRLLGRVADTIHATVYGTLAVASAQGFLGGLMFWWLALPAPLLWGLVMALLSVMPMLGAFIVWIPAALWLIVQGQWTDALILSAWGVFVVGTVDNLLRPMLVGQRLKLHTLGAFVSVVGGLVLFGASGLIIGPVVLAITLELIAIWSKAGPGSPVDAATDPEPGRSSAERPA